MNVLLYCAVYCVNSDLVESISTCGEGGRLELGIVLESGELESWNEVEWYGIEMEWQNLLELL